MLSGSGLAHFDRDPAPGVDYHLIRQALRQGLVVPTAQLAASLKTGGTLEQPDSIGLRMAVLDALIEVATQAGISTAVLDNLYWMNRRVCADDSPACTECVFSAQCARKTQYGSPAEWTRYY
jgi:hypothetical protein